MTLEEIQRGAERLAPWGHSYEVRPGVWIGESRAIDWRVEAFAAKAATLGVEVAKARILDLACLDGRFGIEYGKLGAEVVGVDIRPENIARARFAAEAAELQRVSFVLGDVLSLDVEALGKFDLILNAGLFYHLMEDGCVRLLHDMRKMAKGAVILETHISFEDFLVKGYEALSPVMDRVVDGESYRGRYFLEFPESTPLEDRAADAHASLHNHQSFWFTDPSLVRAAERAGFRLVERFTSRPDVKPEDFGRLGYLFA